MSKSHILKMRSWGTTPALLALAAVAALGVSKPADAAFMAYVCDSADCSGTAVVVTDDGAGDNAAGAGIINFIASDVGGISITVNTSQSKPLLGTGMDLSFVATDANGGGGLVYLWAADTDFTGAATYRGSIGGTADNGALQAIFCGGSSNVQFPYPGTCQLSQVFDSGPFAATFGSLTTTADPYSLMLGVAIELTANGTTTGDFRVDVPEPTTLGLFGLGLLGVASRRRRQRS